MDDIDRLRDRIKSEISCLKNDILDAIPNGKRVFFLHKRPDFSLRRSFIYDLQHKK